jgi:hypothetical protein
MRLLASATVVGFVLTPAALSQAVYPLEQERYVWAEVGLDPADPNQPSVQFAEAPDFDLWQADVCMHSVSNRNASASQYSDLSGTLIDAFGSADIQVGPSEGGSTQCNARSRCRVRFAVPAAATFDLLGDIAVEGQGFATAYYWYMILDLQVELNRIAGETVYSDELVISMNDSDYRPDQILDAPLLVAGELAPGIYELTLYANLYGQAGYYPNTNGALGEASYVASLELSPLPPEDPSQADLDGDGDVDLVDFARFQRAMTGPL